MSHSCSGRASPPSGVSTRSGGGFVATGCDGSKALGNQAPTTIRGVGTLRTVHPIERLRYVARARGADAESLVRETAGALRGLGIDPSGLVVACRRIVERHPTCGPLWWLAARLLTSADPMAAARAAVAEIEADRTADVLASELPDGRDRRHGGVAGDRRAGDRPAG